MNASDSLYIRFGIAIALVSFWAITRLAHTPILESMNFPLAIAPFLLFERSAFSQKFKVLSFETLRSVAVLGLVFAVVLGLSMLVTEDQGKAFAHHPLFVLTIWLIAVAGLSVRVARMQARISSQ